MGAVALFAYFKFLFYTPKSYRAKFVESKIIIKHHFMKILSYEEYQDKMKKIKTPADALGFAQERLIATYGVIIATGVNILNLKGRLFKTPSSCYRTGG
jgi:hypothetical protein